MNHENRTSEGESKCESGDDSDSTPLNVSPEPTKTEAIVAAHDQTTSAERPSATARGEAATSADSIHRILEPPPLSDSGQVPNAAETALKTAPKTQSPWSTKNGKRGLGDEFAKKAGRSVWVTGHNIPAFESIQPGLLYLQGTETTPPPAVTSLSASSEPLIDNELSLSRSEQQESHANLKAARLALRNKQFQEAVVEYNLAIDKLESAGQPAIPELKVALSEMIDLYASLGLSQDVLDTAHRLQKLVTERDRNYVHTLLKMATAEKELGNIESSEAHLLEAIELAGSILPLSDPLHNLLNRSFVELYRSREKSPSAFRAKELDQIKLKNTQELSQPLMTRRRSRIETSEQKKSVWLFDLLQRKLPSFSKMIEHPLLHSRAANSNVVMTLVTVALLMCASATVLVLHFERPGATGTAAGSALTIVPGNYVSSDGLKSITFEGDTCTLSDRGSKLRANYKTISASPSDLKSVLSGWLRHPREQWLQSTALGVVDENGTVYYAKGAPELSIGDKMRWYAEQVAEIYRKTKLYPSDSKGFDAIQNSLYSNPFTGSATRATITAKRFAASDDSWTTRLNAGQGWEGEPAATPGTIHCLCLDYCRFFLRGFDRDGHPLTGADTPCYTIELKDGIDMTRRSSSPSDQNKINTPLHVFISNSAGLSTTVLLLRQAVPIAAWACLFGACFAFSIAAVSLKGQQSTWMKLVTVATVAGCGTVLAFWYYWGLSAQW